MVEPPHPPLIKNMRHRMCESLEGPRVLLKARYLQSPSDQVEGEDSDHGESAGDSASDEVAGVVVDWELEHVVLHVVEGGHIDGDPGGDSQGGGHEAFEETPDSELVVHSGGCTRDAFVVGGGVGREDCSDNV